jgi:predicted AAA+ superfamily ATPase
LRAADSHLNLGGEISYWRTESGVEVDFVWTRGDKAVAIEVKASNVWRREYGKALKALSESGKVQRSFGVYRGKERLRIGSSDVLPCEDFLQKLWKGEILG